MLREWFEQNFGVDNVTLSIWVRLLIVLGIVLAAYLADFILSRIIIPSIRKITSKTETKVDDILLSDKVCRSFSAIVPPVILSFALPFALKGNVQIIMERLTLIYIIVNVCRFLTTFISALHHLFVYKGHEKARSLKGLFQTFQVFIWLFGSIAMVSVLVARSPLILIGGLGAFATVMMLVFQDSIKGLVAGVQLSLNDMVRPGDWIVMPSRNVDGVVKEISLSTVKVQNWDNTIMTIQPYTLITETFQNWKGMQESGGRRICRSVNININSVRFCTLAEFKEWKQKGYLAPDAKEDVATNLEAFRNFFEQYLRNNPAINTEMTLMVRQQPATSEGIPVQIYCFSRTKVWEEYEEIQSQLVEYMLATMGKFGIYVFQRSAGTDDLILTK